MKLNWVILLIGRPKLDGFRLVLVEAYSNVVRHAHKGPAKLTHSSPIRTEGWGTFPGSLGLWSKDMIYQPILRLIPDNLQEGGYGWLILNRLMDKVEYRLQVNGRNCLSLEANISANPSAKPPANPSVPISDNARDHYNDH